MDKDHVMEFISYSVLIVQLFMFKHGSYYVGTLVTRFDIIYIYSTFLSLIIRDFKKDKKKKTIY